MTTGCTQRQSRTQDADGRLVRPAMHRAALVGAVLLLMACQTDGPQGAGPATQATPMAVSQPVQPPAYIRADGRSVSQAFGSATAQRILSDEFRGPRSAAVLASAREVPGYVCPANPIVRLGAVAPFPIRPGAVSWIEHWTLQCDVQVRRNFLAILEGSQLRMVQLLPGATFADPVLQRDAAVGVISSAALERPRECNQPGAVIDTALIDRPERPGVPWTEAWTVMQCDTKVPITVTFTPVQAGGITWSVRRPRA